MLKTKLHKFRHLLIAHKNILIGIGIFLVALLLRIVEVADKLHWTLDEEFWSLLSYQVSTGRNIPLIGGHIGGTGVYSGPLFVWLSGGLFWLMANDPVRVMVVVGGLNALSALCVYRAVSLRHGHPSAVASGLLVATSFLLVLYDRKYWNASLLPLLASVVYWANSEPRLGKTHKVVISSLAAILAFQSHMAGVIVLLWTALWLWRRYHGRALVVMLSLFGLTHLPWFAFELRYDFPSSRAVLELLHGSPSQTGQTSVLAPLRLFVVTLGRSILTQATNRSLELTHCQAYQTSRSMPPIGIYGLLGLGLWKLRESTFRGEQALMAIALGLVGVYYVLAPDLFYQGQLAEYFFLPVMPIWLAVVGVSMANLRTFGYAILGLVITINLSMGLSVVHSVPYRLKHELVSGVIAQLEGRPFELVVEARPCQEFGFLYLFLTQGAVPSASQYDPLLGWLYDLNPKDPKVKVLINQTTNTFSITELDSQLRQTTVD